MAKRKWRDLSPRTKRVLIVGAAVEAALKAAAIVDIRRRPASQIRGPKRAWIPAVTAVNSFGLAPLAYFLFGRRR